MAEQNVKSKSSGFAIWAKERVRKILVAIKRNPQAIPLIALTISFLIFSLNLTDISNTTAKIYGKHMGFCAFMSMLFSMLSFVCMLSAFPKRQKPNWLIIALMYVMFAIILVCDWWYLDRIDYKLRRAEEVFVLTEKEQYILNAQYYVTIHMITLGITMVTVALEPLFAKLFKKINTSIEVEGNGDLGAIDIADEE